MTWCIHGACIRNHTTPVPNGTKQNLTRPVRNGRKQVHNKTTLLIPTPIDGVWSDFGAYVPCNHRCGGGVKWRERTCTNPARKYNGRKCAGKSRDFWKTCNMQVCPPGTPLTRQAQCQAMGRDRYYVMDYKNPCKLLCGSKSNTRLYHYGNVKDGTYVDNVGPNICIEGIPREVGCDLILESGTIRDRCNTCGGNGSACAPVTAKHMKPYQYSGDYEIGIIPKGSINILIEEMQPTTDFLGVKQGTSDLFCYHVPTWSTTAKCAGTSVLYTMEEYHYKDKIQIKGPITEQLRIFYMKRYTNTSGGIRWNYFIPTEGNASTMEYAVSGNWGECSKTCGRGIQARSVICRRTDDKSRVSLPFCAALSKPATSRSCNMHACSAVATPDCEIQACNAYEWKTADGSCSVSCGHGTIAVNVTCFKIPDNTSVDNELCLNSTKPAILKQCNKGICPEVYTWQTTKGACSVTCGNGTAQDAVSCIWERHSVNVSNILCNASTKPSLRPPYECIMSECPETYSWSRMSRGCSVSCGKGVLQLVVKCVKDSNRSQIVNDSLCNATKPSRGSVVSCNMGVCSTIYLWKMFWGNCSVHCGTGIRTSYYKCYMNENDLEIDSSFCSGIMKPKQRIIACSMPTCDYIWEPTYGECLVSCGSGFKMMLVKCKDSNHVEVERSKCSAAHAIMPLQKECENLPNCSKGSKIPKYHGLGCYKEDPYNRRLPFMVGNFRSTINWADMSQTVQKCAMEVDRRNKDSLNPTKFDFFALQDFGECWAGDQSAAATYSTAGASSNCRMGTGGARLVNYVYRFDTTQKQLPAILPIGCFHDDSSLPRPMPVYLDSFMTSIDWNKPWSKIVNDMVKNCALAASNRGFQMFGLQQDGQCYSGPNVRSTYNQDGVSAKCRDGIGGIDNYFVYDFAR